MIKAERLDPSNIKWQNFIVAERDDQIVGIGQLRPYKTYRELGSLVVEKDSVERVSQAASFVT